MKAFLAFLKKEWMEQCRSGRAAILGILFIIFGIMNPAIAKLTPWLLETLSDSLAESGMSVSAVTVDAMTSWTQFFKNIPMGLIAFVLLESSIFTKEYDLGTLLPVLTKGLDRYKVVLAKSALLFALWTLGYFICFAVTYGYNEIFWDNGIAKNLIFSVVSWWLLGLWVISLTVFFSTVSRSNTSVLTFTGGTFLILYLLSLIPKVKSYLPAKLMDTAPLLTGAENMSAYTASLAITAALCAVLIAASIPLFNKKQI